MNLPILERQSEKYGHFGNISAQGIQNLLGAPSLDRLQTVIREAVQNSCDAAKGYDNPEFRIGLRKLTNLELKILRENIFTEIHEHPAEQGLIDFFDMEQPYVLEMSDFGTSGLGGPTDPAEIADEDVVTDYVDFVRNIGSPRDTEHGGGTYGYGKASLYGMSRCSTILIDSLTTVRGQLTRRCVGVRIASNYVVKNGEIKGKYTGRHWWGKYREDRETHDPVNGSEADSVVDALGMPERDEKRTGTTIMILDPLLDDDAEATIREIQRALLWNFWPKMLEHETGDVDMKFVTLLDGIEVPLPKPKNCPPLDLFVRSMQNLKRGGAETISCRNPVMDLGQLAIEKGQRSDRLSGYEALDDGMFPERCCHIALMRPVELVVKYLEGDPFPSDSVEWAGTFVCSDDDEVEKAFAVSEPPAHDDWNPEFLPRGRAKTFVRTALRRIREKMGTVMNARPVDAETKDLPLAPLSDRMGSLLSLSSGDGLAIGSRGHTGGGGGGGGRGRTAKAVRFRNLSGWGPAAMDDGSILAFFSFEIEGPPDGKAHITGKTGVYIDGDVSEKAPNGASPEVKVWLDKDDNLIGEEASLKIDISGNSLIWVGITIPDEVAVTFVPELVEQ